MIPTWELSVDHKEQYRKTCRETITKRGQVLGLFDNVFPPLVRDITPYDFGLKDWNVPAHAPGTFSRWIEREANQPNCNKIIIVYKVVQLSTQPVVNKLAFRSNNALLSSQSLSGLYGIIPILKRVGDDLDRLQAQYGLENLSMDGWFEEPVIFNPYDRILVDTFVEPAKRGFDELVLVGYVAEREDI